MELADLPEAIGQRGPAAFLVTTNENRAHVISVSVALIAGSLQVEAGRRTMRNAVARPQVTLLWPHNAAHPHFSLLVDGHASVSADGAHLVITPSSAVLHRATGRGPDC